MRALIIGLGRAGISAGRYLAARGWEVAGCDRKGSQSAAPEDLKAFASLAWGSEDTALLKGVDLVVPSPGVPPGNPLIEAAEAAGIRVRGEAALALEEAKCPVAVITGTNGKTTTTHLTGQLFASNGYRAAVCGNNGLPVTEAFIDGGGQWDLAVVEMSSFMIDRKGTFVPRAAAILNLTPDHLDRYATLDEYYGSKMSLAHGMGRGQALIVNADCPETMARASRLTGSGWKGRLLTFSRIDQTADCTVDGPTVRAFAGASKISVDISGRRIRGDHNVENILAAVLLGAEMGLGAANMEAGIGAFDPVEHRIEPVREMGGVSFVNDSKGTNPDSTIRAIRSFEGHLSLILGGYDKGSNFDELAREIVARGSIAVVLMGQTAGKIRNSLKAAGYRSEAPVANDLAEAVDRARAMAAGGGVILFSPACASYDMFRNFEERGKIFKTIVGSLT